MMTSSEGSFCIVKIKDGKLVTQGDCQTQSGSAVLRDLDAKVKAREEKIKETAASAEPRSRASSVAPHFNSSQCEFNVSDICYWSYVHPTTKGSVNFTKAQQICVERGSVPAYFPTALAFKKTMESLRAKIKATDGVTRAGVYTGVTIDKKTFTVTNPDKKEVYMKWQPGYPKQCKGCNSVSIHVTSNPDSAKQGMRNYNPSSARYGVICQNNLN